MKQPKKLTRKQKEIVTSRGLVANNWMLLWENQEKFMMKNKKSGKLRPIYKDI